jgi:hypothetical protein
MTTIIDSLLVRLGLDGSDFEKGKAKVDKGLKETGEKAESAGKKLKKSGKDAGDGFTKAAKAAAKFLALIGGTMAIKAFIEDTISSSAVLQRFSKNINESAQSVSAFGSAAEVVGGSSEGLRSALSMLSMEQTKLRQGTSTLLPYFAMLGMSMYDAHGKMLPVSQQLEEIGQNLQKRFPTDRAMQVNIGKQMGLDEGTLNLILRSRGEVEKSIELQKKYNTLTNEQTADQERLSEQISEAGSIWGGLGKKIASDTVPALQVMFDLFSAIGKWMQENEGFVSTFFELLVIGLTAVAVTTAALTIAASPLILTFLAIVAVVTGLSAAIALLWNDFKTWGNGGEALLPWQKMADAINVVKNAAKDACHWIAKALGLSEDEPASGASASGGGSDRDKFINLASVKLGVPASAIDAQLRLETGATGSKTIGNFNYGNIKAGSGYSGDSVGKNVSEVIGGRWVTQKSNFRSYSSPEDAASDYAAMIRRRFPGAVGAQNASDFASGLKAGGYATDPDYVGKIARIAGASQFATGAGARSSVTRANQAARNNSNVQTTIGNITVQTQATDADGMAKDMRRSMDWLFISQANAGLT